jgi:hypothetical protein
MHAMACRVDSSEIGERTASSMASASRSSSIACHLLTRPTAHQLCSCTRAPGATYVGPSRCDDGVRPHVEACRERVAVGCDSVG